MTTAFRHPITTTGHKATGATLLYPAGAPSGAMFTRVGDCSAVLAGHCAMVSALPATAVHIQDQVKVVWVQAGYGILSANCWHRYTARVAAVAAAAGSLL